MKIWEKEIEGSEGEEGGMHGTDGRTDESQKRCKKKLHASKRAKRREGGRKTEDVMRRRRRRWCRQFTVALESLVDDAVEERATVVAEGGAAVGVDLELVPRPAVLRFRKRKKRLSKLFSTTYLRSGA